MKAAAKVQLDQEADALVAAIKANAPTGGDLERQPGELRESVHAQDAQRALRSGGVRTELMKSVVADAKDAKGNFIGPHVEFGHMAEGGGHVAAVPFFFSTWRVRKAGMKRRMAAAQRRAIKSVVGDMLKGG